MNNQIFILLRDEIINGECNNARTLVNVDTNLSVIKSCLKREYHLNLKRGFELVDPDQIIDDFNSDCYFLRMKCVSKSPTERTVVLNYYLYYKFIVVPASFKDTFDQYYDQYSLFKVNLYTAPELYSELEYEVQLMNKSQGGKL